MKLHVREYVTAEGQCPFHEWITGLRDRQARARIFARLTRLEAGNSGDSRSVGKGVRELRIPYGPGYRVYYGQQAETLVLLLCGGDKRTQRKDIKRAQTYWRDYLARED